MDDINFTTIGDFLDLTYKYVKTNPGEQKKFIILDPVNNVPTVKDNIKDNDELIQLYLTKVNNVLRYTGIPQYNMETIRNSSDFNKYGNFMFILNNADKINHLWLTSLTPEQLRSLNLENEASHAEDRIAGFLHVYYPHEFYHGEFSSKDDLEEFLRKMRLEELRKQNNRNLNLGVINFIDKFKIFGEGEAKDNPNLYLSIINTHINRTDDNATIYSYLSTNVEQINTEFQKLSSIDSDDDDEDSFGGGYKSMITKRRSSKRRSSKRRNSKRKNTKRISSKRRSSKRRSSKHRRTKRKSSKRRNSKLRM